RVVSEHGLRSASKIIQSPSAHGPSARGFSVARRAIDAPFPLRAILVLLLPSREKVGDERQTPAGSALNRRPIASTSSFGEHREHLFDLIFSANPKSSSGV